MPAPPSERPARKAVHVLFLQGPSSSYMERAARALLARGHKASHVSLNLGDRLFWRLPTTAYRGDLAGWRPWLARFLDGRDVTHVMFLGDRRDHHLIAADEAHKRGIEVVCCELGYLRPDWLTLERDGMSSMSRLPRDPATIREFAASYPHPDLSTKLTTPFWAMAGRDVLYTLAEVFGRPLYPGYRRHAIFHPFVDYLSWARRWVLSPMERRRTRDTLTTISDGRPYFVFPLQLSTDFQIRHHSRFADMPAAVREVAASFAAHAAPAARLLIKLHPLDSDLERWRSLAGRIARETGLGDRMQFVDGGDLEALLRKAEGCVTVNSTVGILALRRDRPTIALGAAIYDIEGLTHRRGLDAFWSKPQRPDPELLADFLRLVAGAVQLRGGYYTEAGLALAVPETVKRLEEGLPWLPPRQAAGARTP